jgi:hypothetical protein
LQIFGAEFSLDPLHVSENAMLEDREKKEIRAEEIFRAEVRRELEASRPRLSRSERLWALLNSSFALWLLSSVVLAGLTALVTSYHTNRSEELRREETARRLVTEINNRIEEALDALDLDEAGISKGETYVPKDVYTNVVYFLNNRHLADPTSLQDFSIYPDYRSRTFRSLIVELMTTQQRIEQAQLRTALAGFKQLVDLASARESERAVEPSSDSEVRRRSLDAVVNARTILNGKVRGTYLKSSVIP